MSIIRQHEAGQPVLEQGNPPLSDMLTIEMSSTSDTSNDWTIIKEDGKKFVKVKLDAMVAYREKMEGKRDDIPVNEPDNTRFTPEQEKAGLEIFRRIDGPKRETQSEIPDNEILKLIDTVVNGPTLDISRSILDAVRPYLKRELVKMGYLLHSGDPKILWFRTARLARQSGESTSRFALAASGQLAAEVAISCGTLRRAARSRAETGRRGHSNSMAVPSHQNRDHKR